MASVPSSKRTHALALAVVVGRPHDERGVAAGDTDVFRALRLDAALVSGIAGDREGGPT